MKLKFIYLLTIYVFSTNSSSLLPSNNNQLAISYCPIHGKACTVPGNYCKTLFVHNAIPAITKKDIDDLQKIAFEIGQDHRKRNIDDFDRFFEFVLTYNPTKITDLRTIKTMSLTDFDTIEAEYYNGLNIDQILLKLPRVEIPKNNVDYEKNYFTYGVKTITTNEVQRLLEQLKKE